MDFISIVHGERRLAVVTAEERVLVKLVIPTSNGAGAWGNPFPAAEGGKNFQTSDGTKPSKAPRKLRKGIGLWVRPPSERETRSFLRRLGLRKRLPPTHKMAAGGGAR